MYRERIKDNLDQISELVLTIEKFINETEEIDLAMQIKCDVAGDRRDHQYVGVERMFVGYREFRFDV